MKSPQAKFLTDKLKGADAASIRTVALRLNRETISPNLNWEDLANGQAAAGL